MLQLEFHRAAIRLARLVVTPQLAQRYRAVEMRFRVMIIDRDRALELAQRGFRLAEKTQAQSSQVADVRKVRVLRQHAPEIGQRRHVVAALEGFAAALDHLIDGWLHDGNLPLLTGPCYA